MHQRHVTPLVDPDAVLACDRAADIDTQLHDLTRRALHPRELLGVLAVEEDVRVKIAVTRVEDVRDIQTVASPDFLDASQDLGQARPRHRGVLYQ